MYHKIVLFAALVVWHWANRFSDAYTIWKYCVNICVEKHDLFIYKIIENSKIYFIHLNSQFGCGRHVWADWLPWCYWVFEAIINILCWWCFMCTSLCMCMCIIFFCCCCHYFYSISQCRHKPFRVSRVCARQIWIFIHSLEPKTVPNWKIERNVSIF